MTYLHPLIKVGQTGATAESNLQDMAVLRSLPDSIEKDVLINELVQNNVPLVRVVVESYIGLHPKIAYLRDDLFSAGATGLTIAVKKMATRTLPDCTKDNPNGFIRQRIIWHLAQVIRDEYTQQLIPNDYELPYPREVDPRDIIETRDLLKASCLTKEDEVIIAMREKGCTDQEIADSMDITRYAIYMQRRDIERRYNAQVRKNL